MAHLVQTPLLDYGLLAAGLGSCLYLFVSAKREIRAAGRKWAKRHNTLETSLQRLETRLEELAGRLLRSEEQAGLLVPPPPTLSGLNLTTRAQALRMFRRGDPPKQIAAALGIPEQEVELLLKVQQLALGPPTGPTGSPSAPAQPVSAAETPAAELS